MREGQPWRPLGELLMAGVHARRGNPTAAIALLEWAEQAFEAADMNGHADVARRRRGQLLGGDEGKLLAERAEAWLQQSGVRAPDRFAAALAPGFE